MIAAATEQRVPVLEAAREFAWRCPQWWAMALCSAAGAAMTVTAWRHWGHEFHHRMAFGEEFGHWMLMVAAMMLPLAAEPIRDTAVGSLWVRRNRAMGLFLVGYFAPWAAVGVLVCSLRAFDWTHTAWAAAAMFGSRRATVCRSPPSACRFSVRTGSIATKRASTKLPRSERTP